MVDVGKGRIFSVLVLFGAGAFAACGESKAHTGPIDLASAGAGGPASAGRSGQSDGGTGGTETTGGTSDGGKGSGATGGAGNGGRGGSDGGKAGTPIDAPGGMGGEAGGNDALRCTAAEYVNDGSSIGGQGGEGGQNVGPAPTWALVSDDWRMRVETAGEEFIVIGGGEICSEAPSAIVRMRPDGRVVWNASLPAGAGYAETFACTPAGETFFGPGSPESLVTKLDAQGGLAWDFPLPSFTRAPTVEALAPDEQGGVVVTGHFYNPLTQDNARRMYIASIDEAGELRWSMASGIESEGYAVVVDSLGEILLLGWTTTAIDLGSGIPIPAGNFLLKLDASGGHRWQKPAKQQDRIAKGPGDDHLVLRFNGDTAPVPWTLGRYRPDGGVVFEKPAVEGAQLAMGGDRIVTVSYGDRPTVSVYDLQGDPVGDYSYGPAHLHMLGDLAVTPRDDILIFGTFEERIDFGFTNVEEGQSDTTRAYLLSLHAP